LLPLALFSCVTEVDEDLEIESYRGDWAIPALSSEFSINDVLEGIGDNAYLVTEGDSIRIVYSTSIEETLDADYFKIDNQQEGLKYTIEEFGPDLTAIPPTLPLVLPPIPQTFNLSDPVDFNGSEIQADIKTIYLDGGSLELTVDFPANYRDLELLIEIPSIIKPNGEILTFTKSTTGNPTDIFPDLSEYKINLEYEGAYNTFVVILSGNGTVPAEGLQLTDEFSFGFELNNLSYSALEGGIGNFKIPITTEEAEIGFFEGFDLQTAFNLETFGLQAGISADWGIPIELSIETLTFSNSSTNSTTEVTISDPIIMEGLENLDQIGKGVEIENVDYTSKEYPKLKEAINSKPDKFEFALAIEGNPESLDNKTMFISKESKIKFDFEAYVQLHGWLRKFTKRDTIEFDAIDLENNTEIEKGSIRFIIENSIPIGLGVDLTFLDDNNAIVESFIDKVVINAPEVDGLGYAIPQPLSEQIRELDLSKDQLKNITDNSTKVEVSYHISTSGGDKQNPPNVHIRPSDKMKATIGVRATFSTDLSDL
jgi:hypothetical protein